MKEKGQPAGKNWKSMQLDDDGNSFFFLSLFWLGDKRVFVSLREAGIHVNYLTRTCLWIASDFETWKVLALGKTEVFLAQRKIP